MLPHMYMLLCNISILCSKRCIICWYIYTDYCNNWILCGSRWQTYQLTIYYKIILAVCCNWWIVCFDKLTLCCHICTCNCDTYESYVDTNVPIVATYESYVATYIQDVGLKLDVTTYDNCLNMHQHITKMWQHTLNASTNEIYVGHLNKRIFLK